MLEGDKPIICAGKTGIVRIRMRKPTDPIDLGKRYWSMGEEEPCIKCGEPMFYTNSCFQCPACGFREGCG